MCGRMISDPESIQRGFGPVCWAEMHPEKAVTAVDDVPEVVQIPGQMSFDDWLRDCDGKDGEDCRKQEGAAPVFDTEL
jgi:hypothetical protein